MRVWRELSSPVRVLVVVFAVLVVGVGCGLIWATERTDPAVGEATETADDAERETAARLRAHVEHLATTIGERHIGRPGSLERSRAYMRQQLEQAGYTVTEEPFRSYGVDVANLVAELPGHRAPLFVIGAHYDTVPGTPGADDNASGVAALLEMARVLRARSSERKLPYTVRFVAFVNEEPPFFHDETMGSLVHARRSAERGDDLRGMWSLEMLGYYDDAPGSQDYVMGLGLVLPDRGNFIGFVSNVDSRPLLKRTVDAYEPHGAVPGVGLAAPSWVTGVDFSDHWSFWQVGVPAIMITDTAFMRNAHYHEPTDTADTLDYPRMARVVRGLIDAVPAVLAGEPPR